MKRFLEGIAYFGLVIGFDTLISFILQAIGHWLLHWLKYMSVGTVLAGGMILLMGEFLMIMIGCFIAMEQDYDDWNEPYDRY